MGRINRVTLHITACSPGCAHKTCPLYPKLGCNSWQSMVPDHRTSTMQYHLASPAEQAALNLVYSHAQQLFFLRGVLTGQHILQVQETACNYMLVQQAGWMVLLVATTSCAAQHSASQHTGLPLAAVWVSAGQLLCSFIATVRAVECFQGWADQPSSIGVLARHTAAETSSTAQTKCVP